MDLKKIKLFSTIIFGASLLLLAIFIGLTYLGQYMANNISNGIFNVDQIKIVDTSKLVLSAIVLVVIIICWLSLIIQTCRIDNPSESHFFIWLSIFSFIPLFSFVLIMRSAHLISIERNDKVKQLVKELEEIEEQEQYNFQNPIEEEIVYENNEQLDNTNFETIIYEDQDNLANDKLIIEDDKESKKDRKKKLDSKKSNKKVSNKSKQEELTNIFDQDQFFVEKPLFNREKYLSLKGTNYSREKKSGKKKITSTKWNKLILLVDQLERNEISEKDFFKEKSKLLSN